MKSRVHPTYKTKYHVQNWAAYDRALGRRSGEAAEGPGIPGGPDSPPGDTRSDRLGGGSPSQRTKLAREFARAFQEPMPQVVALAVMTDTDDTAGHAVAWYGEVVLHLRTG